MSMVFTDGAWKAAHSILQFVRLKIGENVGKDDVVKVLQQVEQKIQEVMKYAEDDATHLI